MDTAEALSAHPALRRLIDQVNAARSERRALAIRGGGSKDFYGEAIVGEPLDLKPLAGISSFEPSELVVTARAGTPLVELEAALAEHGQCLAFEPPRFGGVRSPATVGGMVAAGMAGPSRAAVGGVRDYVLGVTLLNGQGQVLSFGGQVMKNVAGYDVSRMVAGSLGVLGVILEVSLKVLPFPAASTTLRFDLDEPAARAFMTGLKRQPLPVNASAWHRGGLHLRLAGAKAAVRAAAERLGGTPIDANEASHFWRAVRDQEHPFFIIDHDSLATGQSLWRLSLPATAPALGLAGDQFVEWGGALRWLRTTAPAAEVRAAALAAGGHATLYRAADKSSGVMTPLTPTLLRIQRSLKQAFDPAGIFNPGRLYPGL